MITKRRRAGCFYLGCFAPFAYTVLILWNIIDWLARAVKGKRQGGGLPR
ncbi:MAG: hypothetical protein HS103_02650 [Anaerolineales bacterium]|nr:hypothetical protein [Anaerolineales bacterium]